MSSDQVVKSLPMRLLMRFAEMSSRKAFGVAVTIVFGLILVFMYLVGTLTSG